MIDTLPEHSPLGASSAERWTECPGSVEVTRIWAPPEEESEPEYRSDGTAAHEIAARCLQENRDAFEFVGTQATNGTTVTAEMADALESYLGNVRSYEPYSARYIEVRVSSPQHRMLYGTADCLTVIERTLILHDYKHGIGVLVDAEANKQFLYYAYGALVKLTENFTKDLFDQIIIVVVQPRAFKSNPVDVWEITPAEVREWGEQFLLPAMAAAEFDNRLKAGEHCRFCPVKIACPKMKGMFAAMMADDYAFVDPQAVSDEQLDREYKAIKIVKMRIKAIEAEIDRRLNLGNKFANAKLVHAKVDRVWKEGAEAEIDRQLGPFAFTDPVLRSPAQVEKLGPEGKKLAAEWAYKPEGRAIVAPVDDARPGIRAKTMAENFAGVARNGTHQ